VVSVTVAVMVPSPGQFTSRTASAGPSSAAPGASQAFHTAFNGQADFAQGITELQTAGCDVIVDDVYYLAEPWFQDGIIAQAVDTVVAAGASYFSSAGNQARQSYETPAGFVNSGTLGPGGGSLHDFDTGAGVDAWQQINVPVGTYVIFDLQWDEPYFSATGLGGATNDVDIYLTDDVTRTVLIAGSTVSNVGGDPIEMFSFLNNGSYDFDNSSVPDTTFNLMIELYGGAAPGLMKYMYYPQGGTVTINEYPTNSSTVVGHCNAAGAEAVGAAPYGNTSTLEPFSSAGPTPILYDLGDNPTSDLRDKPEIVGPDGGNTSFFYFGVDAEPDGFPNFFGTSASAPHAAGVAALLLDYAPTLTPTQQYALMEATAIDMSTPGFDYDSGWGFIQADFIGADFSDLAASYGYAYHVYTTTNTLRLGSAWTGDTSFAAGQDDADFSDDGVVRTAAVNWTPGGNGSVDVTWSGCAAGTCYVNAWMDWTNDGDFADAGEQILTNSSVIGASGTTTFGSITVPASPACYPGTCNARFRLTTASGTGITGSAADGEVEDYAWNFGPNVVSVSSASANSGPDAALPGIVAGLCILAGLAATARFLRRRRTI
jgi:hypothetical protein